MIVKNLLDIATLIDHYEINPVGGAKVQWLSTTSYRAVVPPGKRWILLGGLINRNVSSTYSGHIYNNLDKAIMRIANQGAATGLHAFPESGFQTGEAYRLDAGWYVDLAFGTAQDAGSYASCMVLEIDM